MTAVVVDFAAARAKLRPHAAPLVPAPFRIAGLSSAVVEIKVKDRSARVVRIGVLAPGGAVAGFLDVEPEQAQAFAESLFRSATEARLQGVK